MNTYTEMLQDGRCEFGVVRGENRISLGVADTHEVAMSYLRYHQRAAAAAFPAIHETTERIDKCRP